MSLKITASKKARGTQLYDVSYDREVYFTGTMDEVKRFIHLHYTKVRERREASEAHLESIRSAG